MDIFLSFIDIINNSWFWFGPVLAIFALVMAAREIIGVAQEEIEEFRDYRN